MATGDHARGPSSMFELLADFEAQGYTDDMVPKDGGLLCRSCEQTSPPADFEATGIRREEGASDPDDMVAIVGLTCPKCGAKGVLVAHFGPEASVEDADVLRQLDTRGASS